MADWKVETTLPTLVDRRQMHNEITGLATALEGALERYDPPGRVDALDFLIEQLTFQREAAYKFVTADDGKLTG